MRIRTLCAVLTLCAAMTAGASAFRATRSISSAMIAILALIVPATGAVSAAPHRQTTPPSLETVTVKGTSPGLTCGADLDTATASAASVHSATVGRASAAAASTLGISGTTLAYIHPQYHNTWRPN